MIYDIEVQNINLDEYNNTRLFLQSGFGGRLISWKVKFTQKICWWPFRINLPCNYRSRFQVQVKIYSFPGHCKSMRLWSNFKSGTLQDNKDSELSPALTIKGLKESSSYSTSITGRLSKASKTTGYKKSKNTVKKESKSFW